jgi:flagellar P-ring protein precursor FlgI
VTIFERSGNVVVDGDVEIGPVLIALKNNVVVQTGAEVANQFVAVDSQTPENAKLKALLAALDAVRVPSEDVIDIIKALHRDGKLYAQLIIE